MSEEQEQEEEQIEEDEEQKEEGAQRWSTRGGEGGGGQETDARTLSLYEHDRKSTVTPTMSSCGSRAGSGQFACGDTRAFPEPLQKDAAG